MTAVSGPYIMGAMSPAGQAKTPKATQSPRRSTVGQVAEGAIHPSAFISYSRTSPEHIEWVKAFARRLREAAVDVPRRLLESDSWRRQVRIYGTECHRSRGQPRANHH